MVAFLHKELLKKQDICRAPLSFCNGEEALNFLLSETDEQVFYLILLDLNMPVMDGWEFLDELEKTEISARTKVAIVTSSVNQADLQMAEQRDIVDIYLTKPLLDFTPIRHLQKKLESGKKVVRK